MSRTTDPTGLQVIEALCPSVSRYQVEVDQSGPIAGRLEINEFWHSSLIKPPHRAGLYAALAHEYAKRWLDPSTPGYAAVYLDGFGLVEVTAATMRLNGFPVDSEEAARIAFRLRSLAR